MALPFRVRLWHRVLGATSVQRDVPEYGVTNYNVSEKLFNESPRELQSPQNRVIPERREP